jgi:hypothetical protein
VQSVWHHGLHGGWPGYQSGAALFAEVERGDDAAQLPLWAGFLGQRIIVAVQVALKRLDLFNVAHVALCHSRLLYRLRLRD